MNWSYQSDSLTERQTRYRFFIDGAPLTYDHALYLLQGDADFRDSLNNLLIASPYTAYRWEMPSVVRSNLGRQFEFVLTDNPSLNNSPEPEVFASYFTGNQSSSYVLPISNLGGTATLVIPRQIVQSSSYIHLAAFLREAPVLQIHALW